LKGIFLGVRRSDPYSRMQLIEHIRYLLTDSESLEFRQMTDPGWPQILRISPLLDWDYDAVWEFLLKLELEYCELYKKGYRCTRTVRAPLT